MRVQRAGGRAGARLLDVRRELGQRLRVRQDGERGVAQECGVPHACQAQQHRDVVREGRLPEVRVHVVRACARARAGRAAPRRAAARPPRRGARSRKPNAAAAFEPKGGGKLFEQPD
jgi:hypothetical protein